MILISVQDAPISVQDAQHKTAGASCHGAATMASAACWASLPIATAQTMLTGKLVLQAEVHVRDQLAALHAELNALKDSRLRHAEQQKEQVSFPCPGSEKKKKKSITCFSQPTSLIASATQCHLHYKATPFDHSSPALDQRHVQCCSSTCDSKSMLPCSSSKAWSLHLLCQWQQHHRVGLWILDKTCRVWCCRIRS